MNKDINKYYDTLNLMIPIRYQYIKKIIFKYQNKEIVNAFKSKKVLDLGCGTGEFLKIFYDMGANCIGIDSFKNFKVKNFKKIRFINEDIYTYLNKNKNYKFDYIFCFEVIEHLFNPLHLLLQMSNVLNSKGTIFLSTPKRRPHFMWYKYHFHEFSQSELTNLFNRANLYINNKTFKMSGRPLINYFKGIRPLLRLFIERKCLVQLSKK